VGRLTRVDDDAMTALTRGTLHEIALDALALLLPVECASCGAPDRPLCASCRPGLAPDPSSRRLPDGSRVFSGLEYDGVARAVILAFKEQGRTGLARALAPALTAAVAEALASGGPAALADVDLVAVPGTRRARRRRGFDPVTCVIARAGLSPVPLFAPAAPHAQQKTLTVEQRADNLAAVFRVRRPVVGRRILLVDDVVTTGATLSAAARALREAGGVVVGAVAIASTPKVFGSSGGLPHERTVIFP
jgi:ComF family protein